MYKFAIKVKNEEHSKAVQARLFELGYKWNISGSTYYRVDDGRYLYTGYHVKDGITHSNGSNSFPIITLDDLYDMSNTPKLKVDSLKYEIEITDSAVKVGCQSITLDDARKIAEFLTKELQKEEASRT